MQFGFEVVFILDLGMRQKHSHICIFQNYLSFVLFRYFSSWDHNHLYLSFDFVQFFLVVLILFLVVVLLLFLVVLLHVQILARCLAQYHMFVLSVHHLDNQMFYNILYCDFDPIHFVLAYDHSL